MKWKQEQRCTNTPHIYIYIKFMRYKYSAVWKWVYTTKTIITFWLSTVVCTTFHFYPVYSKSIRWILTLLHYLGNKPIKGCLIQNFECAIHFIHAPISLGFKIFKFSVALKTNDIDHRRSFFSRFAFRTNVYLTFRRH